MASVAPLGCSCFGLRGPAHAEGEDRAHVRIDRTGADVPTGMDLPDSPLDEIIRDPSRRDDPWTLYRQIREEHPIYAFPEWGSYLLTRWDDCERVLRDPKFSSDMTKRELPPGVDPVEGGLMDTAGNPEFATLLFLDPPDHTRIRGLVSKAFTPRTVERLRPHISEICDEVLDEAAEPGELDVVNTLGYRVPSTVICELIGRAAVGPRPVRAVGGRRVPDARRARPRRRPSSRAAMFGVMNLLNYFNFLFDERRAAPARRPRLGAAGGGGGGRHALRGRAAQHRAAAVRGRLRDDDEPDRQRHLGAPPATPTSCERLRDRPDADRLVRRGAAPLRRPRPPDRTHRVTRTSRSATGVTVPKGEQVDHAGGGGATATRRGSIDPTSSTSTDPTPATSPSATASTTASAPRWPASRGRSAIGVAGVALRRDRSRSRRRPTATTSCCAGSTRCRVAVA